MSKRGEKYSKFDDAAENDSVDFEAIPNDWELSKVHYVPDELKTPDKPTSTIRVKAINIEIKNGKMLVYNVDNQSEVWWIPMGQVKQTLREQVVSTENQAEWEKPYNWDSEMDAIAITLDELRLGLYYLGYYEKSDLNIRKTIELLLSRGFLPVKVKEKQ